MNFKTLLMFDIFLMLVMLTNAKLPLLFPGPKTTFKLIIGFGVPWDDLVIETITSGMVWRIHFALPGSIEQLTHKTVTKLGRNMEVDDDVQLLGNATLGAANRPQLQKYILSSYRWGVYQSLEGLAKRMGLNGRDCILKSICEAAEEPFHFGNGMWAELMHILLAPSSSADKLSEHSDNEYYQAERLGHSGAGCQRVFRNCPRSLLDHFSNFYKLTDELRAVF